MDGAVRQTRATRVFPIDPNPAHAVNCPAVRMRFTFLDPGPLVDNELQLVAPQSAYVDELLRSSWHPLTVRDAPMDAHLSRGKVMDFLRAAPMGRQSGDDASGRVPAYHFWM